MPLSLPGAPDVSLLPVVPGMELLAGPVHLGRGWDNDMWHVGVLEDRTKVVLRRPHRDLGRQALRTEIQVLGEMEPARRFLAPRLLATIPEDEPLGPASLMTWIEGTVLADLLRADLVLEQDAGTSRRWADRLAEALAELHRPARDDHPRSTFRGVPFAQRAEGAQQVLADLALAGVAAEEVASLRETLRRGLDAAPWEGPALRLHGDPHPANLVAVPDGRLGLIDWGDATAGDPASDLGFLHLLDPSGAAVGTYAHAAGIPHDVPALSARSAAWGSLLAAVIIVHAAAGGDGAQAGLEACSRRLLRDGAR